MVKGINVYGLIGAEAYSYPAESWTISWPGLAIAISWINGYTANFVSIADIFKTKYRYSNLITSQTTGPTVIQRSFILRGFH